MLNIEISNETCPCCATEVDASELHEFGCERCIDAAAHNAELALMFDEISGDDVNRFAEEQEAWIQSAVSTVS